MSRSIPHRDDSMPPRLAELIEERGYLGAAVTDYVLEQMADAGDVALFAQRFPDLFAQYEEELWTDPDLGFDELDEMVGELEDLSPAALRDLGFTFLGPVISIRDDSWDRVVLGIATTTVHDWWYAWLDSGYAGEYYTWVGGPTPISLENRRRTVLDFAASDEWIAAPVEITTRLSKADADWLSEAQSIPVSRMAPPLVWLDPERAPKR